MIYLALGSNLGNRLHNLDKAVIALKEVFRIEKVSHVIETKALLLPDSPASWDIPYLNMMVAGDTDLSPSELLNFIKITETKLGRNKLSGRWSPRVIDIDIVKYHDKVMSTNKLTIPHAQLSNRDFWKYQLELLDCPMNDVVVNNYRAMNYMVLSPKIFKIVNVTPDSFSDGGKFFEPEEAIKEIEQSYQDGAFYVDVGAQSTRPGYKEISPQEEINRLEPVLKNVSKQIPLSIDTYFDDVVNYFIDSVNLQVINAISLKLSDQTLKRIADKNLKMITMMYGVDMSALECQVAYLRNRGVQNIIVDPGLGFGKTKLDNLTMLKCIPEIKNLGCEVLIAHSRKSFLNLCSNYPFSERDIETLAVSDFVQQYDVDYIRVHNLKAHMRFFTTQKMLQPSVY